MTTGKRLPSLPDVPTMVEAGGPNSEFAPWWGAFVPAGTPPDIVVKLGRWMNEISSSPDAAKFLETIASIPMVETGEQTAARIQSDIKIWEPIVKAAKIEAVDVSQ